MELSGFKQPGVYVTESNPFPVSVVPVPTSVPAFIGYTPQAIYKGKSVVDQTVRITSFIDFKAIYGFPDPPSPAPPARQYSPEYYLEKMNGEDENEVSLTIGAEKYALVPDPNTIYYFYNSIRFFFENGGGTAYIVSIGNYGPASRTPVAPGSQIVNPNVKLADLLRGLQLLKKEDEPTMYVVPEATLLSQADHGTLMKAMLAQNGEMGTAISIFDVIGGRNPDPLNWQTDIQNFRQETGTQDLNYGTVYYPFVRASIMEASEFDYTNLFGGDTTRLRPLLSPPGSPNPTAEQILTKIQGQSGSVAENHQALLKASTKYQQIIDKVCEAANILPPSGGMAGIMTFIDQSRGVWTSPANISMTSVKGLTIDLTDKDQGGLNVDPVAGKSVNCLRNFQANGILVWGARTLDGNSQDYRYLSVRRTLIFIENSARLFLNAVVFQPNDSQTWRQVKAGLDGFLAGIWNQGGLQGPAPSDAFEVMCGMGTTMTSDDVLNGTLNVSIKVALTHPAEFIIITLSQQMAAPQ